MEIAPAMAAIEVEFAENEGLGFWGQRVLWRRVGWKSPWGWGYLRLCHCVCAVGSGSGVTRGGEWTEGRFVS